MYQKYLLCWEHEYFISHNKITFVEVTFCVFFLQFISVKNFFHFTWLHCLKETAQFCKFYSGVFEMDRKCLELCALCFHAGHLPS
jgi:hypothetical protein